MSKIDVERPLSFLCKLRPGPELVSLDFIIQFPNAKVLEYNFFILFR